MDQVQFAADEDVEVLFLRHEVSLRGYILGLLADRSAADDVFQEIFITVVRRAKDYRRDGDFMAWMRGIARNKVRESYRQRRFSPFDEQTMELLADEAEQMDHLIEQKRELLAGCLDRLSPRSRQIIEMRYAEKPMSPQEIADRLSWTIGAVNVALSKARSFLRECVRHKTENADKARLLSTAAA